MRGQGSNRAFCEGFIADLRYERRSEFVENKLKQTADVLRPFSSVTSAGATILTGLRGNISIPRLATGSAPGFLAETTQQRRLSVTASQSYRSPRRGSRERTVSEREIALLERENLESQKRVFSEVRFSRQLVEESQFDTEKFITTTILRDIAAVMDFACLNGLAASSQPIGVLNMSENVGAADDYSLLSPGLSFGVAASWVDLVAMSTEPSSHDVAPNESCAWIVSPNTRKKWMTTPKIAGFPSYLMEPDGSVAGYKSICTSNLSATNQAVFGRWDSLLVGIRAIDVMSDTYTLMS